MEKVYGYIRVSTKEQNLDRQKESISNYCETNDINIDIDRDIIEDKQSGKDFERPGYLFLKEKLLRSGDTVIIKELDRLGRDMQMIKEEWNELQGRNISIVVIDTPILNTVGKSDLEKTLISNIVFELLSYMAEKERRKIKQRQAEGLAVMPVGKDGKKYSKKTGKSIGRPSLKFPDSWPNIYNKWKAKEITASKAMEELDLKRTSFYKLVKLYEN